MDIRWLVDALADITEIYRYVADDDPTTVGRIHAAIRLLREAPHRGRPGRWPGTRELVVSRTPYIVPYRVAGDLIEILRVVHGSRRWPPEPPNSRSARMI